MNQQRVRRFKAAKEIEEVSFVILQIMIFTTRMFSFYFFIVKELRIFHYQASKRESLTGIGGTGVEEDKVPKLDSNVITPGTEFMEKLASALRYYIHMKMNSDPGWQGVKVLYFCRSQIISFTR